MSYAYDDNGNRVVADAPAGAVTATYDTEDHLLTYGNTSFSYTANGDLIAKTVGGATTTYEYDALGNLTRVTLPDGRVIRYIVDGGGRRVQKLIDDVPVRGWLWADERRPIAEIDGTGNVVARFVYASRSTVPDMIIKGPQTYRVIADHVGSPRLLIDTATGAIAQRLDFGAFGELIQDTNPGFQPFGFAGGLWDADTGLVRFGARDYDPVVGRWTTKDPVLFGGDETNLYAYVSNNPTSFVDPEGTDALSAASDFFAGFGDTLTSGFGVTDMLGVPSGTELARDLLGDLMGEDVNSVVDRCSAAYLGGQLAGVAWGAAFNGVGYRTGKEFKFGKNLRLAPWGNRKGDNPLNKPPHYHRRGKTGPDGNPLPGEGMSRHRPWQPPAPGRSWFSRF